MLGGQSEGRWGDYDDLNSSDRNNTHHDFDDLDSLVYALAELQSVQERERAVDARSFKRGCGCRSRWQARQRCRRAGGANSNDDNSDDEDEGVDVPFAGRAAPGAPGAPEGGRGESVSPPHLSEVTTVATERSQEDRVAGALVTAHLTSPRSQPLSGQRLMRQPPPEDNEDQSENKSNGGDDEGPNGVDVNFTRNSKTNESDESTSGREHCTRRQSGFCATPKQSSVAGLPA